MRACMHTCTHMYVYDDGDADAGDVDHDGDDGHNNDVERSPNPKGTLGTRRTPTRHEQAAKQAKLSS
eukprot:12892684-Prorocentrum_lima.AAC.1